MKAGQEDCPESFLEDQTSICFTIKGMRISLDCDDLKKHLEKVVSGVTCVEKTKETLKERHSGDLKDSQLWHQVGSLP